MCKAADLLERLYRTSNNIDATLRKEIENFLKANQDPANQAIVTLAQEKARANRIGDLEVDDGAVVSAGDRGAYIEAWLWLEFPPATTVERPSPPERTTRQTKGPQNSAKRAAQ